MLEFSTLHISENKDETLDFIMFSDGKEPCGRVLSRRSSCLWGWVLYKPSGSSEDEATAAGRTKT